MNPAEERLLASLKQLAVPEHLHEGLVMYVVHRRETGGFLTKVLENDLLGAFERGDGESLAGLGAIVSWLYNEVPRKCWGSRSAVASWLAG